MDEPQPRQASRDGGSAPAKVRAFVGIDLPPACKALAERLSRAVAAAAPRPVSRLRGDNVHLTLQFLGDVPADGPGGIPAVREALAAVAFAPFALRLAGGGFFPDALRPRVVWAGLAEGAPQCRALAGQVVAVLAPLGFPPEAKPYRPHLTLGRVRLPGRGDWTAALRLLTGAVWPAMTVTSFTLWRSILSPAGARHDVLAVFPASTGPDGPGPDASPLPA
jgi:2'-5' RNA ligase